MAVPVAACLSLTVAAVATVRTDGPAYAQVDSQPPPCAPPVSETPPPLKLTTIATIERAHYCTFANYYGGRCLTTGTPAGPRSAPCTRKSPASCAPGAGTESAGTPA
jgi:hypothetical protein